MLRKIEDGALDPSASIFRAMADVYLLPEATLMGLIPPAERELPKDFRSFDGARVALCYETIMAVRRVQTRQEALERLAEIDANVIAPELPIHTLRDDPDELGARFRRELGFDVLNQLRLTTQKAFNRWRLMIEDMGISVYIEPLGEDDSRGASIFFNDFPAIIVDHNEKQYGARSFTLFHEFAHLLIRQTGISNLSPQNRVEQFCNRFAAAFLMPRDAIQAVFDLEGGKIAEPSITELEFASRKLCVTISQLALRLEHLRIVAPGYYSSVVKVLKPPAPQKRGDSRPQWKLVYLARYGNNLPTVVLDSLERGRIGPVEAARMLDAAPASLKAVRKTLDQRREELRDAGP